MANADPTLLASQLRRMAGEAGGGLPDADLLRRYAEHRDPAAFEVLVWRHAPMVWAVCKRTLHHAQDAEDAFQATFLALARSANRVGGDAVGGWLHRVAVNAALKVRSRRRPTELLPADVPGPPDDPDSREVSGAVDEELDRLPDHYRSAFVLCCLEGLTNTEAARELGCAVGTVDSRLHAARTRLRDRLARRGLAPVVLGSLAAGNPAPAAVAAVVAFATEPGSARPAVAELAAALGTGKRLTVAAVLAAGTVGLAMAGVAALLFTTPPEKPAGPPLAVGAPVPRFAPADPAPANSAPALLFTELVLKPGEDSSRTVALVKVRFKDGKPVERETLYTSDASEFGFQGRYRLVANRYVVLESATVIDSTNAKQLHRFPSGTVTRVEGTRVYFYDGRDDGERGVFCFDIATEKREKVAEHGDARWTLRGAVSSDGSKSIVSRDLLPFPEIKPEASYELLLNRPGNPQQSLGEFACTIGTNGAGWVGDTPPGVWLDNDRFLTQSTLGSVVVIDTTTGKSTLLVQIPPTHKPGEKAWNVIGADGYTPLGLQQPRFSLLPDGRVLYEADVMYAIDVAAKKWEKLAWRPIGGGFAFGAVPDIKDTDPYSKQVTVPLRYLGKEIGTSQGVWWGTPEKPRAVTTDGHLAVIDRVQRSPKQVPTDAVRVWTAATGDWIVLDGWADSVIGWVK